MHPKPKNEACSCSHLLLLGFACLSFPYVAGTRSIIGTHNFAFAIIRTTIITIIFSTRCVQFINRRHFLNRVHQAVAESTPELKPSILFDAFNTLSTLTIINTLKSSTRRKTNVRITFPVLIKAISRSTCYLVVKFIAGEIR